MTVSGDAACGKTISDEKFGKCDHMLKSKDFRLAYKNGKSVKKAGFVLVVARNGLARNRLGFSISSSSVKSSCTRNRIRRLFREAYRKNKKLFAKAFDIVVIARKSPVELNYDKALSTLISLAKESGILV